MPAVASTRILLGVFSGRHVLPSLGPARFSAPPCRPGLRRTDLPLTVALAVEGLAGTAGLIGDHRRAARLLGVATALREAAGAPLPSDERHDVHRIAARTRDALGDADFAAELRRGGRLDLDDPAVLGDGQWEVSAP